MNGDGVELYKFSEISQLHIEVTSSCNASCPMCTRNVNGGKINPHLKISQLTINNVREKLPIEFIKNLDLIYFCGNYGDPSMGKDTLEIVKYFKSVKEDLKIGFYSNGGARGPKWWHELAQFVDYCQFDIDGLSDTNHLHRRRTVWSKIMQNTEAFINAGGSAIWEFIVFEHNQHQIEEARRLSVEKGFKHFVPKKTNRFVSIETGKAIEKWDVFDQKDRFQYSLKPTTIPDFINREALALGSVDYGKYLDTTKIICKVKIDKSIYLSADGYLFPCCWMAHIYNRDVSETKQVVDLISDDSGSIDDVNIFNRSFGEIIEGDFFQKKVGSSWNCSSVADGRLRVCARVCGALDTTKSQFEQSEAQGLHVPGGGKISADNTNTSR